MELIRIEDIHKIYRLGEVDVPVLRGVSLSIARGEMVALMGASGSGKTTLMTLRGCLDRPTSGRYWVDGQEMSRLSANQRAVVRAEKLGFVFQNFNLLPRTTALDNVTMPLDYAPHRVHAAEAQRWAKTLLDRVGLSDRIEHEPSQMSGGQQQRVAIGRALVNRPMLLLADEPTGNLDSHTSVEILRMFQQLNAEGITVVLVTHDPKVAGYAHRVIRIADGVIEGDEANPRPQDEGWESVAASSSDPPATVKPRRRGRLHFPPTWRTALGALRRNKLRSLLTALGVIIGVGAVIAMMEIGQGSKAALQRSIASMGANTLMIHAGVAATGGVSFGAGTVITLTPQDAEEIAKQCPAVAEVAPVVRARAQIVYGRSNWVPMFIYGTTPSFLSVRDWEAMAEGEMFTENDVRNASMVCVIGETLRRELLQEESPLGKELRIKNVPFRIIGVLSRKGANMMGMDQDDVVVDPWTTIKYRISGSSLGNVHQSAAATRGAQINTLRNLYPGSTSLYPAPSAAQLANSPRLGRFVNIDQILVKAGSESEVPQAVEQITALMRERHRSQPGDPDDFIIRDMAEISNLLNTATRNITGLLLVVAMISLVVGGVGIMNIMLVSVTERTREIGLRMAVGARGHHILRQFLVEAIVLCLFGGAMGILAGRGSSMLVRSVMNWPTEASMPAIVAAVVVSATVGVVFGFYPAWKASRLDPIEALRYE